MSFDRPNCGATRKATHGHGDHFFGAGTILKRFRAARFVATARVVKKMREQASPHSIASFWNVRLPGQIPDHLVIAEELPDAVIAGHKRAENDDSPRIIEETRQYIRDFDRLVEKTTTARELYDKMLELHRDRANPGALWASARAMKG